MEITMREVLIGVMVLVIAAIIIDGLRRANNARNGRLKLKIDQSLRFDEEDDYPSAELPNGGARRASREPEIGDVSDADDSNSFDDYPDEPHIDTASSSDSGSVPMLMETMEQESEAISDGEQQDLFGEEAEGEALEEEVPAVATENEAAPSQTTSQQPEQEQKEVIVMHVMANADPFDGQALLDLVVQQGLRLGEMNIFHALDDAGAQQFSMANAVNPGTFELESMAQLAYPGVTFFMQLPGPDNSVAALDKMLACADAIANNLQGSVLDENRRSLSTQGRNLLKQKTQEFDRKKRLVSA